VFLINSRSGLATAAPTSSESKSLHQQGRTFSRSYGTILPSSFTRVLSSALVFSTFPPVSVYGTVTCYLKLRRFSWKHGINTFVPMLGPHITPQDSATPDFPKVTPYTLVPARPTAGVFSLLRPSIAITVGAGILTCFPSTTLFSLALGTD
jgi:hypothetical protein